MINPTVVTASKSRSFHVHTKNSGQPGTTASWVRSPQKKTETDSPPVPPKTKNKTKQNKKPQKTQREKGNKEKSTHRKQKMQKSENFRKSAFNNLQKKKDNILIK